jgi:hypothetical protein
VEDVSGGGSVFLVHHSYETDGGADETKLIGAFSSRAAADAAIQRLCELPGFRELPDHFSVDEYALDEVQWSEGFFTPDDVQVWSVWRQDDHGNVFLVSSGHTEAEALREVRGLEKKGHKQLYWAKGNN